MADAWSIRCRRIWLCAVRNAAAIAYAATSIMAVAADNGSAAGDPSAVAQILVMIRMEPAHFRPDVDYGDGYARRAALPARQRTARAIAQAHGLQLLSHWPMPAIGVECYLMQLPPGASLETVLAALERDERAVWAQAMQTFSSRAYNDPLYDLQPAAGAWQLHRLHQVASGRGVLIAQIDSGVDVEHPDLRGQLQSVQNTVDGSPYAAEQHGTAVAGIIAARADNGVGIAGVAPAARLLVLRGCREPIPGRAVCDTLSLAKALQAALDRRAQVVNLSVGGPPDRLLGTLLDATLARGVIVVAADSGHAGIGFPASHAGVIAVSDTASPRARPVLVAAGTDVPTTLPDARWGMVSGASFSAAAVSGVVALLFEMQPGADAARIDALLRQGSQEVAVGSTLPAPQVVDACRSVSLAAGRCACNCDDARATSPAKSPAALTENRRAREPGEPQGIGTGPLRGVP